MRLADILEHLDLSALRDLAEHQLGTGAAPRDVAQDIATAIDQLIPWDEILVGPAGAVVEALDGTVALAIGSLIVSGVRKRQARRAARRG